MALRPESGSVPDQPGSYQFKDSGGRIIYVGKAKSLRNRLNSFSRRPESASSHSSNVESAATVEWIEVATEVDALMLEQLDSEAPAEVQRSTPR